MSPDAPAPATCAVLGCGAEAERHIALTEVRKVFPEVREKGRHAPLCKDHYKEWKKSTKEARKLARLDWK